MVSVACATVPLSDDRMPHQGPAIPEEAPPSSVLWGMCRAPTLRQRLTEAVTPEGLGLEIWTTVASITSVAKKLNMSRVAAGQGGTAPVQLRGHWAQSLRPSQPVAL